MEIRGALFYIIWMLIVCCKEDICGYSFDYLISTFFLLYLIWMEYSVK